MNNHTLPNVTDDSYGEFIQCWLGWNSQTRTDNLNGAWLTNGEVMTKLYQGLMATPKHPYALDVASIGRRCALSQKPMRGFPITDNGIENMDFTLTHVRRTRTYSCASVRTL